MKKLAIIVMLSMVAFAAKAQNDAISKYFSKPALKLMLPDISLLKKS